MVNKNNIIIIAIAVVITAWLFSYSLEVREDLKNTQKQLDNEKQIRNDLQIKIDSLNSHIAYQEKREDYLVHKLDSIRKRPPLKERIVIRVNELDNITDEQLQELFNKWYKKNKNNETFEH